MSEPTTEDDETLKNVVLAFLKLIPKPTSDQTHALAGLLGFEFMEFEDRMREVLTPYIEDEEVDPLTVNVKKIDIEVDNELDDPLETFLLAFYMLNPEPSEQQLLILSVLVDLTAEELEEKTYAVINKLMEAHPVGDDTDLNDPDAANDFEVEDIEDFDDEEEEGSDEKTDDNDDADDKSEEAASDDDGDSIQLL